MDCPFLTGKYMLSCTALAVYIPTTFEFEEYCRKTLHTMCPYYMKRNAEPNLFQTRFSSLPGVKNNLP